MDKQKKINKKTLMRMILAQNFVMIARWFLIRVVRW